MDPLSLLAAVGAGAGWLLAILNIREKLWPKPTTPHPLEAAMRDVARAIREGTHDRAA
jgi:hypothetical protein